MANRTATYFAFDGLGEANPAASDFRYYSTVQAWNASNSIEFKFVNSHDKASSVRDSSKLETLKASIRTRLAASKNMVVILSPDTRKSGSLLSYEVEKAVDYYEIPLIICHTNLSYVLEPQSLKLNMADALRLRLDNSTANAIHIPFKKDALLDAISQFTVNSNSLEGPWVYYTRETQRRWGYID